VSSVSLRTLYLVCFFATAVESDSVEATPTI
jgi:hypothetical protein